MEKNNIEGCNSISNQESDLDPVNLNSDPGQDVLKHDRIRILDTPDSRIRDLMERMGWVYGEGGEEGLVLTISCTEAPPILSSSKRCTCKLGFRSGYM